MILKRFRLNHLNRKINDVYGAIVAQSRHAAFYIGYGVPDTMDGRFYPIVLHMVLLLARFDREGAIHARTWPGPVRSFLRDLDANLQEMGVGNLAVSERNAAVCRSVLWKTGRLSRRSRCPGRART